MSSQTESERSEEEATLADPATLVCPGCHQPTDPSSNLCDHCGYLHLGRLVTSGPSVETDEPETLLEHFMRSLREHLAAPPVSDTPHTADQEDAQQFAEGDEQPAGEGGGAAPVGFREVLATHDLDGAVGGIIVTIIGAVVLCGGLLLHNHYEPLKQACNSGVGAFAQEINSSALKHCSLNGFLADLGQVVVIIAGLMLLVGIVTVIAAKQRRSAPDQSAP